MLLYLSYFCFSYYYYTVDSRYKRTRYKRILASSVLTCWDIFTQAILQAPLLDISVICAIRVKRSKTIKTLKVNMYGDCNEVEMAGYVS